MPPPKKHKIQRISQDKLVKQMDTANLAHLKAITGKNLTIP